MDKLFDRLGDMLRSFLRDSPRTRQPGTTDTDPDFRDAWEELNAYLRDADTGHERAPGSGPGAAASRVPERLRTDYANLEVPFGAPFERVQQSYRRLMTQYHPDRNASDAERLRIATEIAKKINASYQRIRDFESS
jgi:DnaJ-domain-containing protein 1